MCLILEGLGIILLQEGPMATCLEGPTEKQPLPYATQKIPLRQSLAILFKKLTRVLRAFPWYPSIHNMHTTHHSTPPSTPVALSPQGVRLGSRVPSLLALNCPVQDLLCSRYHKLAQQINEAFKQQQLYVGAPSFIYHLSSQPACSCLQQLVPYMT